jgi:tetratricopeptide (TPR) repeat protein
MAHEGASTKAPQASAVADAAPALSGAEAQYGLVHFPASCTPSAQAQLDLGVSQLHSFFFPETVETFTRIIGSEPGCAMAYWGLAFAQMPNPLVPPFDPAALKRASDAVEKGKSLASTQREKDWLAAAEPLYREAEAVDQLERTRRYATAMEALASRCPDDAEAQIFFALALLQSEDPHDRTFASQFRAAKILERLEATHPRHPGIVHYEIHAYAYLQQGRDQEALRMVADTAAIQKLNVTSLAQATGLAAVPVRYALERGAWTEAASLEIRPATFPYAEAVGHFGRALGAAHLGKPGNQVEARAEIEKMKKLRAAYLPRPDQAYWAEQTEILIDAASGWLARAEGNDARAEQMLRAGADLEDASEKHVAMENRVFPVREQLGYLLLDLGRAEAALVEFQTSLKSTPNRLRGYYGAARAAELAGYSAIARDYQEQLRLLTANATGRRVEVEYARQAVAVGR